MWDIMAITSYLFGSLIYFYLPSIPDFALVRDRLGKGTSAIKRKFYTLLSVGWRGTPEQEKRLERAIGIMAITIIPIAISVHTVVSFIFSMTLRPGWDSTIFGIYFVIGAIFSGIASIIILMVFFRKFYHLEEYLTVKHFRYLGYLLLVALLLYAYLTFQEYLTVAYKLEVEEKHLFELLMQGMNAFWFWFFVVAGMVIPAILLIFRRGPAIPKILIAAVLVNIGMWIKRFVIVIPTLEVPMMPFEFAAYTPTWVEVSITAGSFAAFVLILVLFAKVVPLISIWEVAEEAEMEELPLVGEEEK
jgi:molybdopterin-containing oxidoreductase family membrane subunit